MSEQERCKCDVCGKVILKDEAQYCDECSKMTCYDCAGVFGYCLKCEEKHGLADEDQNSEEIQEVEV